MTNLQARNKPQQERSRKRVNFILDMAEQLVMEKGFESVTAQMISKETNISPGVIYHYFPGKHGIFAAVAVGGTGTEDDPHTVELSDNSPQDSFKVEFDSERPVIVAVQLIGDTLPQNSAIDIDVNIVSPNGTSEPLFVQELWHETGTDEDGRWVETQYETSEMFVPVQLGSHELEISYDGSVLDDLTLQVTIRRDHIMPLWFFIYAVLSGIAAAIFAVMASSQQQSRT